jgi:hypothetical protein
MGGGSRLHLSRTLDLHESGGLNATTDRSRIVPMNRTLENVLPDLERTAKRLARPPWSHQSTVRVLALRFATCRSLRIVAADFHDEPLGRPRVARRPRPASPSGKSGREGVVDDGVDDLRKYPDVP